MNPKVGTIRAQYIIDDIPDLQEYSQVYGEMKKLPDASKKFDAELTGLEKVL